MTQATKDDMSTTRTRRVARYKAFATEDNRCEFHDLGQALSSQAISLFWAPASGGYVYDVTASPGTTGQQVCDRLESSGSALYWTPTMGPLSRLIRREAQRAFRAVDVEAQS